MGEARHRFEVIDEARAAGEQRLVLEPLDALANPFFGHRRASQLVAEIGGANVRVGAHILRPAGRKNRAVHHHGDAVGQA